jgi:hypothetical protein
LSASFSKKATGTPFFAKVFHWYRESEITDEIGSLKTQAVAFLFTEQKTMN